MLQYILYFGIFVLITCGLPFFERVIKEYRYNNNVKDCINKRLINLYELQRELKNDAEYALDDKDSGAIEIILKQFKESLSEDYLSGRLPKYTKSAEVSALLYLRDFVIKNQDEMRLCDFEMYRLDELTRNSFIKKFYLTDFAITYHKVLYILHSYYAKLNKITSENNAVIHEIKRIQETIDNGWTR
jgi:hypothetical protein